MGGRFGNPAAISKPQVGVVEISFDIRMGKGAGDRGIENPLLSHTSTQSEPSCETGWLAGEMFSNPLGSLK
jgi:hypothetical protein